MAGNFQNTTLGVGTEIKVDGVDIGYTKGDITFTRESETLDFETGVPLNTVGRVPLTDKWGVVVPVAEITAKNVAIAALNIPVTPVTSGSNTETEQVHTFTEFAGGAIQRIVLDHGTNYSAITVEDVGGMGSTYAVNTDYIVDADLGVIYRNPGGGISSKASVQVTYTYDKIAKNRLNLGKSSGVIERSFEFTHVSPVSGDSIVVVFHKAMAAASMELNFQERDFMTVSLDLQSIPDPTNHPDNPMGYIDFIPA